MAADRGDVMAGAGAIWIAVSSFLPYWARLEVTSPSSLALLGGPTRFDVWDAYGEPVLLGIAVSFMVIGIVVARVLGRARPAPRIYLVAGVISFVCLLYGIWEGPTELFGRPLAGASTAPQSFTLERGVLLYLALIAAGVIAVGGATQRRLSSEPSGLVEEEAR